MTQKERILLQRVGYYVLDGGTDGDFYPEWVADWTTAELKAFAIAFAEDNGDEDDDEIECSIFNLSVAMVFYYLLSKVTEEYQS